MLRTVPCIAVLMATLSSSTVIEQAQVRGPNVPPTERLFLAQFSLSIIEEPYQKEYARLAQVCKDSRFDCMKQNLVPFRAPVATVRHAPDPSSPIAGSIVAVMKLQQYEQSGNISFGLDFESANTPGRPVTWINDVGDWGYGIHVAGVRPQGDWIQLIGAPFPASAWIPALGESFSGYVEPLDDQILNLESMQATGPDGTPRTIRRDAYKILSSKAGTIEFRAEVPSDMACGEEVKPPSVMPPTLRAPASEFFRPDGTPRFATKYTRGC
jgi:hypothetical protein